MKKRQTVPSESPTEWQEEARERWGDTEAYRQSAQRTSRYGRKEWDAIRAELSAIDQGFAALMDREPGSPEVQALCERNRQAFDRWFYDCTPEFLRNVSDLWVNDPRFRENIDRTAPGLAEFKHRAVQIFAQRARAGS